MLYKGTPKYCIIQYISKEFLMCSFPAENPSRSRLLQASVGSRQLADSSQLQWGRKPANKTETIHTKRQDLEKAVRSSEVTWRVGESVPMQDEDSH